MVFTLDTILDPLIDQIQPDQIITGNIHLIVTTLYFILFLISLFFIYKIREGFISAGQWDQGYLGKGFFGSFIGLSVIILNFVISHFWLYLTDGTEILMFNEKGMVAGIGFLIFMGLFPYASLVIVHVSDSVKKTAKILLWTAEGILSFGLVLVILSILSVLPLDINFVIIILGLIGITMGILVFLTTIILIRESRNSFSKINKIRLRILVFGIIFFVIDLSSTMITFLTRSGDPQLYVLWLYFIQPIQRFITFTVTFSLFYLSFFFPLWLQKRTGALPPSFEELMKKRQSMQWNKIVQRKTAEQQ